ncbi:hypothetical protein OGATHE_002386 [Ogataea polymorpha]|uniref:Uncharacterized protein n=1 Tax=Ogataea polymorpha TaxID=460523 RepID=A0A9P8T8I9_9ASCO|nr:hypothetical protein OGATHE_002386 [Ogataea polymorpha]
MFNEVYNVVVPFLGVVLLLFSFNSVQSISQVEVSLEQGNNQADTADTKSTAEEKVTDILVSFDTCNSVIRTPWESRNNGNGLEIGKGPGGITNVLGKTLRKVHVWNASLSSQLGTHSITTITDGGENQGGHNDTERRTIFHLGGMHHQSKTNQSDTRAKHLENLVPTEISPVSVGKIQNDQVVRAKVKQPEVTTHLIAEIDDDAADEGSVQKNALRKQWVWRNPNLVDSVHDQENSSDNLHGNH